ncbi:hypothetical protein CVT26_003237 [Gymnopilus dilepis]|uniref:Uncharacterized protein n=1 Tax=Gymnopilus dilepis TaxID=231916 RepID=A0A409Y5F4_9AGAR|nr:hypothetical protein CVT26_003237 [Gymnopilus dilepis]
MKISRNSTSQLPVPTVEMTENDTSPQLQNDGIIREEYEGPVIDPRLEEESRWMTENLKGHREIVQVPPKRPAEPCGQLTVNLEEQSSYGEFDPGEEHNDETGRKPKKKTRLEKSHECKICQKKFNR